VIGVCEGLTGLKWFTNVTRSRKIWISTIIAWIRMLAHPNLNIFPFQIPLITFSECYSIINDTTTIRANKIENHFLKECYFLKLKSRIVSNSISDWTQVNSSTQTNLVGVELSAWNPLFRIKLARKDKIIVQHE
jgi:hypothetical protein